jgi:hypothetical protein
MGSGPGMKDETIVHRYISPEEMREGLSQARKEKTMTRAEDVAQDICDDVEDIEINSTAYQQLKIAITKALREYGDARLEKAAEIVVSMSRMNSTNLPCVSHNVGVAAAIRALKGKK